MIVNGACRVQIATAIFLLSLLSARASAVDAAHPNTSAGDGKIDEIVVVAHKDERAIRDIAANVTVISSDDIDAMLVTSMSDVFQYTPGIDYESGGSRFAAEGINIRGIGGNRVGLLIDGVPLSDQFDVGSFSNATRDFFNTGFIQRIEVLHGPGSALPGPWRSPCRRRVDRADADARVVDWLG